MTTPADERITVGLVRGLHGLRGAVRVEVLSDEPERFAVGSVLYAEGDERPLTVTWTGPAKPGLLVRFEELSTRESVEHLRERYLEAVPASRCPRAPGTGTRSAGSRSRPRAARTWARSWMSSGPARERSTWSGAGASARCWSRA